MECIRNARNLLATL